MNLRMWGKALRIIPRISKKEWQALDIVSRWLISTRAAVLVMTFLSAALAGIFAFRDHGFQIIPWLLVTFGLCLAHATNNLFNDYTDFVRGVDKNNYYRAQYGPQPLVHGLLTKRGILTYAAVTGLLALACGVPLVAWRGPELLLLLAAGVFFVFCYTWPLKYIALGELAVLLVWGPFMIGGGYFAVTGLWSWNVVLAGLPYALGVTTVIFGKHIDKLEMDRKLRIHTLPVLIGEKAGRIAVVAMMILQYAVIGLLCIMGFFTPVMAIVLVAVYTLVTKVRPLFRAPRPAKKPAGFPDVWPNYFVAAAFVHNRTFGFLFLIGLVADTILKLLVLN